MLASAAMATAYIDYTRETLDNVFNRVDTKSVPYAPLLAFGKTEDGLIFCMASMKAKETNYMTDIMSWSSAVPRLGECFFSYIIPFVDIEHYRRATLGITDCSRTAR